jgi:hemerythrin-like metal-binding protein
LNQAVAIDLLAECGALSAALEAEHDAVESALWTLNKAMLAGAEQPVVLRLFDGIVEHCRVHFLQEETHMTANGCARLEDHSAAHQQITRRIQEVREAIVRSEPDCSLNVADLLLVLRRHIDAFDRPAYDGMLRRNSGEPRNEVQVAHELARLERHGKLGLVGI